MTTGRLLDPAGLQRLANLQLEARTVAEGALSGLHRAAHHGASVEFAEHKEYAPGDELRHIDWRAYGRMDKFYVKRFEEETELRGYLVLDASGSMGYGRDGHRSKLEYGKLVAAALGYVLLRQRDQAGLLVYTTEPSAYLPPRGRAAHLSDLCDTLVRVEPGGATDLGRTLTYLSEVARRRSLIVVLSDLFPPPLSPEAGRGAGAGRAGAQGDAAAREAQGRLADDRLALAAASLRARLAGLRARRHDVVVLQLLDPDELELPFEGPTWFEDLEPYSEDGAAPRLRRLLADPADVRRAYQEELAAFLDGMRRGLRESDVEYHLVPTTRPPEDVLLDLLRGPLRGRVRR